MQNDPHEGLVEAVHGPPARKERLTPSAEQSAISLSFQPADVLTADGDG